MRNKYKGADIRARLGSTIIRWKGRPFWCEVEGETINLMDIVTKQSIARVDPDDTDLDISSLTLGYFNIGDCAVFLARQPLRRYKQGVDPNLLTIATLSNSHRVDANGILCQGLVDGLMDRYPMFKEAIKKVSKVQSVALSRDVALLRDKDLVKVHVKGSEVGWIKLGATTMDKVYVPPSDTSWITVYILQQTSDQWEVIEGVK